MKFNEYTGLVGLILIGIIAMSGMFMTFSINNSGQAIRHVYVPSERGLNEEGLGAVQESDFIIPAHIKAELLSEPAILQTYTDLLKSNGDEDADLFLFLLYGIRECPAIAENAENYESWDEVISDVNSCTAIPKQSREHFAQEITNYQYSKKNVLRPISIVINGVSCVNGDLWGCGRLVNDLFH